MQQKLPGSSVIYQLLPGSYSVVTEYEERHFSLIFQKSMRLYFSQNTITTEKIYIVP